MKPLSFSEDVRAKTELAALFRHSPVLVEVRFPKMGTSPDWYLCQAEEELTSILNRLSLGAELHLSSVWDLKNPSREITLRK